MERVLGPEISGCSGEVLGARWREIDFEAKIWTLPAGRTKAARMHRIPLSHRVTAWANYCDGGLEPRAHG
jgi:integrase